MRARRRAARAAAAVLAAAVLLAACPSAAAIELASVAASAAAPEPAFAQGGHAGLTDIVKAADPTVVGIVGKLGQNSREYDSMSDNIVIASGIVYAANGFIVTNQHVVDGCESLFAVLSDRRVYEARVVGQDALSDIALIKIDKGMLRPAEFADSAAVQVGDSVITIGTPIALDLQNTVGYGIVSGVNRGNTGFAEYEFLQTDAIANPGNSGGPLVDMQGRVVGMIEGGYAQLQGLNFVIPSSTIMYVAPQLMERGYVERAWLGAKLVQGLIADYGLPSDAGLFFSDIEPGGPADRAGIAEDDTLVSMGGVKLTTFTAYAEELKKYKPGDEVELVIESGGETRAALAQFDEMQETHSWQ